MVLHSLEGNSVQAETFGGPEASKGELKHSAHPCGLPHYGLWTTGHIVMILLKSGSHQHETEQTDGSCNVLHALSGQKSWGLAF